MEPTDTLIMALEAITHVLTLSNAYLHLIPTDMHYNNTCSRYEFWNLPTLSFVVFPSLTLWAY